LPYISVIVPTLNEAKYIGNLMTSIEKQNYRDFEVIIVDGGSKDRTTEIVRAFGAKTLLLPQTKEFPSRNAGASLASGEIILFTGADMVFPENVFEKIAEKFQDDNLLAVAGPGIPYDAPLIIQLEFSVYNTLRYVFARLPKPFRQYSASTNLLAVRKKTFEEIGGLTSNDVNADGLLGKKLSSHGKVYFSLIEIRAYQSARRVREMGSIKFNVHFFYVLENFFPFMSKTNLVRNLKNESSKRHSQMRKNENYDHKTQTESRDEADVDIHT
jgi:glycosyltransferase involved in cell wall biosynthesis